MHYYFWIFFSFLELHSISRVKNKTKLFIPKKVLKQIFMKINIVKNADSGFKLFQPENVEYRRFIEVCKFKMTFFSFIWFVLLNNFYSCYWKSLTLGIVNIFEQLNWIRINKYKYHENSTKIVVFLFSNHCGNKLY